MISVNRSVVSSAAAFVCMVVAGCGGAGGGAPEAGVLDPGKKPGMTPTTKAGDTKPAGEAKPAADAKPAANAKTEAKPQ